jgi:hypothetical protein
MTQYPPADDRLRHLLAQEINTSVDTWKLAFWIAGNIVKSPEIRREMARILSAHTLGRPCGDRNCEHCYDASLNAPVAASAVVPAADRAALRDRIRRAVCEAEGFMWNTELLEPDEYGEVADAVLSVLPAPADRAAVLEAADWFDRDGRSVSRFWGHQVAAELRRMAVESAAVDRVAAETPPAAPGTRVCAHCGDPITAPTAWISRPGSDGDRYYHLTVPACRAAACTHDAHAAVEAQPGKDTETRIVGYRSRDGRSLYCPRHAGEIFGFGWWPVDSDDLPDGGICTYPECGVDVLIPIPQQRPE